MPLYLGLDCGVQSLRAIVIEVEGVHRRTVFQHALNFDRDLSVYGTTAGVCHGSDPGDTHASPIMWADALDRMMALLATTAEVDVHQIGAISGSAQQHATVYLNRHARDAWRSFDHTRPLAPQLVGAFSRLESPVWLDASVSEQIRDCHDRNPGAYAATTRIHTVGSFLASLLVGGDAPIDFGDGSGTGLMDLSAGDWSPAALDATAPGLRMRLPDLRPSSTIAGPLAAYWRDRYSMPAASVVVWCGDRPSTLIGTGVVTEGTLAVSLGTSDTVVASTREPRPGSSHVFASPTGAFASMVRFHNGSLAREFIRCEHGLDWSAFWRRFDETPAGNDGAFMLPWLEDELTPQVRYRGIRRFGFGAGHPARDVRAIVEAQMMAMANHAAEIAAAPIVRIVATGDGTIAQAMLQIIADTCAARSASWNAAVRPAWARRCAPITRIGCIKVSRSSGQAWCAGSPTHWRSSRWTQFRPTSRSMRS